MDCLIMPAIFFNEVPIPSQKCALLFMCVEGVVLNPAFANSCDSFLFNCVECVVIFILHFNNEIDIYRSHYYPRLYVEHSLQTPKLASSILSGLFSNDITPSF